MDDGEYAGESEADEKSAADFEAEVSFCPYCGAKAEKTFRFCQKCGKRIR